MNEDFDRKKGMILLFQHLMTINILLYYCASSNPLTLKLSKR